MIHYVYAIINSNGIYEHIGETNNPELRFKNHKSINGKFNNRQDIEIDILDFFYDRKLAYQKQIYLQKEYGLLTDTEIHLTNLNSGLKAHNKELCCPNCNFKGKGWVMHRWHFNNCKHKKQ